LVIPPNVLAKTLERFKMPCPYANFKRVIKIDSCPGMEMQFGKANISA